MARTQFTGVRTIRAGFVVALAVLIAGGCTHAVTIDAPADIVKHLQEQPLPPRLVNPHMPESVETIINLTCGPGSIGLALQACGSPHEGPGLIDGGPGPSGP